MNRSDLCRQRKSERFKRFIRLFASCRTFIKFSFCSFYAQGSHGSQQNCNKIVTFSLLIFVGKYDKIVLEKTVYFMG